MKSRKITSAGVAILFGLALVTGRAAPMPDKSPEERAAVAAVEPTDCAKEARGDELQVQQTVRVLSKRSDSATLSEDEMHEYRMSTCLAMRGAIAVAKELGAPGADSLADVPFILQDTANGATNNAEYDWSARVVRIGAGIKKEMEQPELAGLTAPGFRWVLGHELGHAANEHAFSRISMQWGGALLSTAAAIVAALTWSRVGTQSSRRRSSVRAAFFAVIVVGAGMYTYGTAAVSKRNELDADKYGVEVLARTIPLAKVPQAASPLELAKQIAHAALKVHPEEEASPFTSLNVHPSTTARQLALHDFQGYPAKPAR